MKKIRPGLILMMAATLSLVVGTAVGVREVLRMLGGGFDEYQAEAVPLLASSLSPGELSELYLLTYASLDTQFQFWIWISFAVVAAGFVAGKTLTQEFRRLIVLIYAIAVATLAFRLINISFGFRLLQSASGELGTALFPTFGSVVLLRFFLFVVGTSATVFFVLKGPANHREE